MEESPKDTGKTQSRALGEFPCRAVSHRVGIPLFYALCAHSEVAKNKNVLPESHKGSLSPISLLFLCQAGKNQRTDCIVISTWVLENLIHPAQSLIPSFCPKCTSSMCQSCSLLSVVVLTLLGPLLLTLLIIGHDWCWGDKEKMVDLQDLLKFMYKQSKETFHWLGITFLPFSIILPADSWQTQLCCFQLQLPHALKKERDQRE